MVIAFPTPFSLLISTIIHLPIAVKEMKYSLQKYGEKIQQEQTDED